jgi:hypothetical protein
MLKNVPRNVFKPMAECVLGRLKSRGDYKNDIGFMEIGC